MKDELVIGRVRSSFGLSGEIKVESFSGETNHFRVLKEVRLRSRGKVTTYSIESVRVSHKTVLVKLQGIDAPEAVAPLRGAEVLVDRRKAARLKRGEYYYADLEELRVTVDGEVVGRICAIWEAGEHPLLEIDLDSGERRLVPFESHFFGEVDMKAQQLELIEPAVLE